MILVDFSQFVVGASMAYLYKELETPSPAAKNMIKHLFFSMLLQYKKKFSEYGEVIICCDGDYYWRQKYFPYYKYNRKKMKEESHVDWDFIYETVDELTKRPLNKVFDEINSVLAPAPGRISDDMIILKCFL